MRADEAGPAELRVREALRSALARAVANPSEPTPHLTPLPTPRQSAPVGVGRPITFNAAMARALVLRHKTQTRRPITAPAGSTVVHKGCPWPVDEAGAPLRCALADAGSLLWVREPWRMEGPRRLFEADFGPAAAATATWKPGRFLPRDASRLVLCVTDVRPQRLATMTAEEAQQEGLPPGLLVDRHDAATYAIEWFRGLWDSFYGRSGFAWERNPWVWVIRFRVVEAIP